eukprot:1159975-Pelagomonas_calceolata.AAC.7
MPASRASFGRLKCSSKGMQSKGMLLKSSQCELYPKKGKKQIDPTGTGVTAMLPEVRCQWEMNGLTVLNCLV